MITNTRFETFKSWIKSHCGSPSLKRHIDIQKIRVFSQYINKKSQVLNGGYATTVKIPVKTGSKLKINISTKGRNFPEKAWDETYYEDMAKAKFVLCPNGDFIWTYRFFEAIMCGAIPIIESSTEIYEGYHYYLLDQSPDKYIYDYDIALHNYNQAYKRLIIPKTDLNKQISGYILNN